MSRIARRHLLAIALAVMVRPALALQPDALAQESIVKLDRAQSRAFVQWLVRIIGLQLKSPTPRWQQRDCAGLVRFAAAESLRPHDAAWRKANGLTGSARGTLPPELNLSPAQQSLRHQWLQADGSRSAYVNAFGLIAHNSRRISRDMAAAQAGDLLFFDQGDAQHLMVWLGHMVAYHNGQSPGELAAGDTGMRAVPLPQLLRWPDTRWRPDANNPNFMGVYRLAFLT